MDAAIVFLCIIAALMAILAYAMMERTESARRRVIDDELAKIARRAVMEQQRGNQQALHDLMVERDVLLAIRRAYWR